MKYLLTVLIAISCSLSLMAQDQIITREGDIIDGEVIKIGTSEIEYKKADNLEGPIYTILKNDVLSIKYENGTVEKFEIEEEAPAPSETTTTTTATTVTNPSQGSNKAKGNNIGYNNTFRFGYSRLILKNPGNPGSAGANTLTIDIEGRKSERVGVRYPIYLTLSNGFYSIAMGTNIKVFLNDHHIVRGFIGPEFTVGYVTGSFFEGTVVGDFGVDVNPIPRMNVSFHTGIGWYGISDFSAVADALLVRITFALGVNF